MSWDDQPPVLSLSIIEEQGASAQPAKAMTNSHLLCYFCPLLAAYNNGMPLLFYSCCISAVWCKCGQSGFVKTVLFPSLLEVVHLLISMIQFKISIKFFFTLLIWVGEVLNIILFSVVISLISTLETLKRNFFFVIKNGLIETECGHCPHQHHSACPEPLYVSKHKCHI